MNKYQVLSILEEADYFKLYKCLNKETQKIIAIKAYKLNINQVEEKKRIEREVKIKKMLHHKNIVDIIEICQKNNEIYIVEEYVEISLSNYLKQGSQQKGLDQNVIPNIMYQVLSSINQCHKYDIIHQNIKPMHIYINPSNYELKLNGFRLARQLPQKGEIVTDYVEARWYKSPEYLLDYRKYGKPEDIWAAACVMAELIDGEPLFPGQGEIDQFYRIVQVIGPLTNQYENLFKKKYKDLKFPIIKNFNSIELRYQGKINAEGLDLMKMMLKMNPDERITAEQSLSHPFFDKLKSKIDNEKGAFIQNKLSNQIKENLKNQAHQDLQKN
ncbi:cyclin-dependent kinase-like Serine/Threonine kinase family protein (macronuclear) [Tetrahymena thermophila SB210]|uniref:Cyclin-dependent kinase-like Serine/Threonine kinase family protein n=1 Tax=Tetrahymena thermophila (strain SB210) TaxID=312017 RepID=W7XCW7_TETTS|nr:cyclin-dependent kinase-like Serine/Threonine kinase family protein [Tetrahymena thermophila SB210]EWS71656.1 cyclin-dependent kinase-like Serine/Threonine kinase family protein [Tetrahymena thermophila SB210]|eukprot:XP_012655816.1 cyclin-dependent kinase-like Serine/Threonine kinase family protein [Tetrahymena thermophila SB210]